LEKWLPIARDELGPDHDLVLVFNEHWAIYKLRFTLVWTAAWRTMNKILAKKRRVYGKRHPKTLATEEHIQMTRMLQRCVIEELIPTGEWSTIVSKRRAFVRLLKKP
jgi:hypothetical protein